MKVAIMSKYEPLTHFLEGSKQTRIELSFRDIEKIIDADLPPSSYKHRALWSNNPQNHVMTQAWLSAGYESEEVDMQAQRVVFRRVKRSSGKASGHEPSGEELLAKLMGCMKGTVHIPEGIDIMEPIELEWDAMKD